MVEIRFSGLGGQGIIKCGYIAGKAISIFDNNYATMTQSFGPEARGSACSSQLVVCKDKILYPYITRSSILVSMSQEAYDKYESELGEKGIVIVDKDLVKPKRHGDIKIFTIPATKYAEELGNKIVANVVMLGFFAAVTNIVSYDAMRKSIPGSVPDKTLPLNLRAFEKGYEYGRQFRNTDN